MGEKENPLRVVRIGVRLGAFVVHAMNTAPVKDGALVGNAVE